jgi:hypothetical protein
LTSFIIDARIAVKEVGEEDGTPRPRRFRPQKSNCC